jgi:hypothetical protein
LKRTSDIRKDFVKLVLKQDRKTKENCSANLETLFIDLNKLLELLDDAHSFLDRFLQVRKVIDEEKRLREEAKKKKKGKEAEEETEDSEESSEEETEEDEEDKPPKFVAKVLGYEERFGSFFSKIGKSISDTSATKENAKEIKAIAKGSMSSDDFPEKLMKSRLDFFVSKLKTEDVEKTLSDVVIAKKSYQMLSENLIPALEGIEFVSSSEVSALGKSSFIDSYAKMQDYAGNKKEEFIEAIGPGVLGTIKDSFSDIFNTLFGSLHEFYSGMLDDQLLSFIKNYKKLHFTCLKDIHKVDKVMAKQKIFLSEKARKALNKINEIVSK